MQPSSALRTFERTVAAFVAWAESGEVSSSDAPAVALRLLSAMYAEAARLLEAENAGSLRAIPEVPDTYRVAPGAAIELFRQFPAQYYWTSIEPLSMQPASPGCGDLADDLADTYSDVKEGLIGYQSGEIEWAKKHWLGSFLVHWGAHISSALSPLHELAYSADAL